jgi:hypothetical protein
MPAWRRMFQTITGKPFCPMAAIAAPEAYRRVRLADENPARVLALQREVRAGFGNPHGVGDTKGFVVRAPLRKLMGAPKVPHGTSGTTSP